MVIQSSFCFANTNSGELNQQFNLWSERNYVSKRPLCYLGTLEIKKDGHIRSSRTFETKPDNMYYIWCVYKNTIVSENSQKLTCSIPHITDPTPLPQPKIYYSTSRTHKLVCPSSQSTLLLVFQEIDIHQSNHVWWHLCLIKDILCSHRTLSWHL